MEIKKISTWSLPGTHKKYLISLCSKDNKNISPMLTQKFWNSYWRW